MKKSILYFIQGPVPTPAESQEAAEVQEQTGISVQLRNAQWAQPGDDDFRNFIDVIGCVPSFYNITESKAGEDEMEPEVSQEELEAQLAAYLASGSVATNVQDEDAEDAEDAEKQDTAVAEEKTVLEEAAELPPVAVSPLKKPRGRPAKAKPSATKE